MIVNGFIFIDGLYYIIIIFCPARVMHFFLYIKYSVPSQWLFIIKARKKDSLWLGASQKLLCRFNLIFGFIIITKNYRRGDKRGVTDRGA